MMDHDDRFDDEEDIRLNRSLGIDENREGSGWNQPLCLWHSCPRGTVENSRYCWEHHKRDTESSRKPYVKPSVTPVQPTQRPRSTTEPVEYPETLCDDCMKPLVHTDKGCQCWRKYL